MKAISIFNDVLGPVMRGPSSSHTAASYHIGRLARELLGAKVDTATFTFDPDGSYAQVYAQQGSDRAFAAGLMGWSITDGRFHQALDQAATQGIELLFEVQPLRHAGHPNTVEIRLESETGGTLHLVADSIGGGAVVVTRLDGWPLRLTGDAHEVLVELEDGDAPAARDLLQRDGLLLEPLAEQAKDGLLFLHARRSSALDAAARGELETLPGLRCIWTAPPIFFAQRGQPLLSSAAEMAALAEREAPAPWARSPWPMNRRCWASPKGPSWTRCSAASRSCRPPWSAAWARTCRPCNCCGPPPARSSSPKRPGACPPAASTPAPPPAPWPSCTSTAAMAWSAPPPRPERPASSPPWP